MEFWTNFFVFVSEHLDELLEQSWEHLYLTLIALSGSIIIGLLLGIISTRLPSIQKIIMGAVNGIQTIPSIALLGFMIPLLGIGVIPAIVALFLYGLLPIVKNTITGIESIDKSVVEAAQGMGFSENDILKKVTLPLATPIIFSGIRVAFVINIGVATLCALIAAGGLGEFIFRGLSTNNPHMILAGAIPATVMALSFDFILSLVQRNIKLVLKPIVIIFIAIVCLSIMVNIWPSNMKKYTAGFPSEFIERGDGYRGLSQKYNLNLEVKEMEIGLMYTALMSDQVDVISGFSTDGKIKAFDLKALNDNLNYFPPYHAAPLVSKETLDRYPQLESVFNILENSISDEEMSQLNYRVEEKNEEPSKVAKDFLKELRITPRENSAGEPDIIIGSKNFTESYILAEIFKGLIEGKTNLKVEIKPGFGGTLLIFEALKNGNIDLYPEYIGTGLLVILKNEGKIPYEKDSVYNLVSREFIRKYQLKWLPPLGFNNTFALMVRSEFARKNNLNNISDLK